MHQHCLANILYDFFVWFLVLGAMMLSQVAVQDSDTGAACCIAALMIFAYPCLRIAY
jgi:hypothetical protein